MDQNTKYCPCCGRHCDLSTPHCKRGEEYARTGVIPEGYTHHDHGKPGDQSSFESHDRHEEFHGHRKPGPETKNDSKMDRYELQDMDNKLLWNLRELGHTLRHQSEGKGSQKRILLMLEEMGTISQSDLTRRLGIQPGSASEVLGKLEAAGLIMRTPSKADRRTTEVSLTDAGRQNAVEANAHRNQRHSALFSCLTEEEKEALLPLLEKLNAAWNQQQREFGHQHHGKDHHGHGHEHHKGHHHGPHHGHYGEDSDVEIH